MREDLITLAERELNEVATLLNESFCDDGLVFYHLKNGTIYLLKALAEELNLDYEGIENISELVSLIEQKSTIKLPDYIQPILDLEEIMIPDGCSASICYDPEMYGDILDAVEMLKEFVEGEIEKG
ncbi:hypothetical protein [Persephonella sp.]